MVELALQQILHHFQNSAHHTSIAGVLYPSCVYSLMTDSLLVAVYTDHINIIG